MAMMIWWFDLAGWDSSPDRNGKLTESEIECFRGDRQNNQATHTRNKQKPHRTHKRKTTTKAADTEQHKGGRPPKVTEANKQQAERPHRVSKGKHNNLD